jgi:hypothetical protein
MVIFAPTIPSPEGPKHEQVLYDGPDVKVSYPKPGDHVGVLTVELGDGKRTTHNWLQVRSVEADEFAAIRP